MTIYMHWDGEPTRHPDPQEAESELEGYCVSELDNDKVRAMDERGRYWYVNIKATLTPSDEYDEQELAEFEEHFRLEHEATAVHAPPEAGERCDVSPTKKHYGWATNEEGKCVACGARVCPECGKTICHHVFVRPEDYQREYAPTRTFVVSVRPLVDVKDLHPEDENVPRMWSCYARSEDHALDQFHNTVPVKVLDHFVILAYPAGEKPPETVEKSEQLPEKAREAVREIASAALDLIERHINGAYIEDGEFGLVAADLREAIAEAEKKS